MTAIQTLFDRAKRAFPGTSMYDGVPVKLQYRCGFEAFNNRPYVCYETWCCGYEVSCEMPNGIKRAVSGSTPEKAAEHALDVCFTDYPETHDDR